ncbi:MAG: hypothetical protein DMG71_11410 [Acidobacteria bacterium]|nr:MAG: hypothetical protein DMG71_11410 [Acidobacteriota bacterium]
MTGQLVPTGIHEVSALFTPILPVKQSTVLPGVMHIPTVLAFLAIAAEFFGGMGLIFGFLTRLAAFGIFSNMIVAVAMVHHNFGFFMNWTGAQKDEGYEYHLLVLAVTAFLMIRGAGAASLDRLLSSSAGQEINAQAA